MFVIEFIYKVFLDVIDDVMKVYVVFLNEYYVVGMFVVFGWKILCDGGIILVVGKMCEEIELFM